MAESVRQNSWRPSGRHLAAFVVLLLMLGMMVGVIGPVLPAQANQPYVVAEAACVDGAVVIQWNAFSWLQTGGPGSGNPDIQIRFDSVPVASGAFTAENGYEFSGQNPWPNPDIQLPDQPADTVYVLAYAVAPFDNGTNQGSSARWTVTLPAGFAADCASPTTTTSQPPTTTTTSGTTTTTSGPQSNTTTQTPTSGSVPETLVLATQVTGPESGVLGIQVSAPAPQVNQVTLETLPFTGISTGSIALIAAALSGAGLLLLLTARKNDGDRKPNRSWN